MRVLIIGATGLLGHSMFRQWKTRAGWDVAGTYCSLPFPGMSALNALDDGAVQKILAENRPEAVIFTASDPNVNYCESHPDQTRRINVDATLAVARRSREAGARFVFLSTDYVFDGLRGGYREEDVPNPTCEYGRQKLEAERALQSFGSAALVLRISGLFGWEFRGKNFVLRTIKALSAGQGVPAAVDQQYNPSYAEDVAAAAAALIERRAGGLFHVVGSEAMTRHAFARGIADVFGLDPALVIESRLADLNAKTGTQRPRLTSLSTDKLRLETGSSLRGARDALLRMRDSGQAWKSYAAGACARIET